MGRGHAQKQNPFPNVQAPGALLGFTRGCEEIHRDETSLQYRGQRDVLTKRSVSERAFSRAAARDLRASVVAPSACFSCSPETASCPMLPRRTAASCSSACRVGGDEGEMR